MITGGCQHAQRATVQTKDGKLRCDALTARDHLDRTGLAMEEVFTAAVK
jgi:hypothetical protein